MSRYMGNFTAACTGHSDEGWGEVVQSDEHTKQELVPEATQNSACVILAKGMDSMTK